MQFPISIELRRSTLLLLLLLIVHALALACVIVLPWSWPLRTAAIGAIAWSLSRALRPPRIIGLRLCDKGRLEGKLAGGDSAELAVTSDSTVFNRLIVLRFSLGDGGGIGSLPLLPDQMSPEHFRRLRLWLRWRAEARNVS